MQTFKNADFVFFVALIPLSSWALALCHWASETCTCSFRLSTRPADPVP